MAKIFENRQTDYNGLEENDVVAGTGEIFVYFNVDYQEQSILQLMARKTGTSDPFVEIRRDVKDAMYKADMTGLDYYFKWKVTQSYYKVRGTLDV